MQVNGSLNVDALKSTVIMMLIHMDQVDESMSYEVKQCVCDVT